MKGITRSFWILTTTVVLIEAYILTVAIRSVASDLTCWLPGHVSVASSTAACGTSIALVGTLSWIPAGLVLCLVGSSIGAGLGSLVAQLVRTRKALRELGPAVSTPEHLKRIEDVLGIRVSLRRDARYFCCCADSLFPRVMMSTAMFDLFNEGDAQLTAVLAHEAAHVLRRDPARSIAVRCASNAMYFVPLARQLSKRALTAAELGADAYAVREAGRKALVGALVQILGRSRPVLGSATEIASLDSLDVRIEALTTETVPRLRPGITVALVSVAALVGVGLLGTWLPAPVSRVISHPAHVITHRSIP
jgi:beta-lactamase regulating signal transducer with metallopeptidase domain